MRDLNSEKNPKISRVRVTQYFVKNVLFRDFNSSYFPIFLIVRVTLDMNIIVTLTIK
jgi:hypothetical protein